MSHWPNNYCVRAKEVVENVRLLIRRKRNEREDRKDDNWTKNAKMNHLKAEDKKGDGSCFLSTQDNIERQCGRNR